MNDYSSSLKIKYRTYTLLMLVRGYNGEDIGFARGAFASEL